MSHFTPQEFQKAQAAIDQAKADEARALGSIEQADADLKARFGYDTPEEAEAACETLRQQLTAIDRRADAQYDDLRESFRKAGVIL